MTWTGITRDGREVTEATEGELCDLHGPLVWDGPTRAADSDPTVRAARLRADPTLATDEELPDLAADLVRNGRSAELAAELERRRTATPRSLNRSMTGALVAEEATVPTPTDPPAEVEPSFPVRIWRSIWRTPLAYRWLGLAIVAFVALGWVAMVWDIGTGGGDHRGPSYQIPLTVQVDLCPSTWTTDAPVDLEAARVIADAHACYGPDLAPDPCVGPPRPGHIQVRDWLDGVSEVIDGREIYPRGLLDGYSGHVAWHPHIPGTGVLHWRDGHTSAEGEWLHIVGVGNGWPDGSDGHSTRATSVASSTHEGTSWADVDCSGGAP